MSDRIVVINHGELSQIDTPHTIYNQPANAFVADFIGESTMLPLSGNGTGDLHFKDQHITTDKQYRNDDGAVLVIRPERLFLFSDNNADREKTVVFDGVVKEFVFQGETAFVVISISDQHTLSFRFGTDASSTTSHLQAGQAISVGLERRNIIIIPKDAEP